MIRDLFLGMTGTAGDAQSLQAGIALASAMQAHLSVLETVALPLPMPTPWGITPDAMLGDLHAELRGRGERNVARLRERLSRETIGSEVRLVETRFTDPPRLLAAHARQADLSIVTAAPRTEPDDAGLVESVFAALLFESGRPVLALPPDHALELPVRHAVVAWQPTREATRALHDALPLLARAASVDVLTIAEDRQEGELADADIAVHLARHGLQANIVVQPLRERETIATALLRHAADSGAQLLVAGGYGHSRLREWVLGGTTRELLQAICLPILFSH